MAGPDDLNPSGTGLTTKEVLLEVRQDVKSLVRDVAVLTSQNLDNRVNELEAWRDRVNGRVNVLLVLVGLMGTLMTIAAGAVAVLKFLE